MKKYYKGRSKQDGRYYEIDTDNYDNNVNTNRIVCRHIGYSKLEVIYGLIETWRAEEISEEYIRKSKLMGRWL